MGGCRVSRRRCIDRFCHCTSSYLHPFGITKSRCAVVIKAWRDGLPALEARPGLPVMAYGLARTVGNDDRITVFRAMLRISEAVEQPQCINLSRAALPCQKCRAGKTCEVLIRLELICLRFSAWREKRRRRTYRLRRRSLRMRRAPRQEARKTATQDQNYRCSALSHHAHLMPP